MRDFLFLLGKDRNVNTGESETGFGLCGEEELTRYESLMSDHSSVNHFAIRPSWTESCITRRRSTLRATLGSAKANIEAHKRA